MIMVIYAVYCVQKKLSFPFFISKTVFYQHKIKSLFITNHLFVSDIL